MSFSFSLSIFTLQIDICEFNRCFEVKSFLQNSQLNIKISVLKSCCRDRNELKKIADEILEKLGKTYTAKIIGYTIIVKKWRREMR